MDLVWLICHKANCISAEAYDSPYECPGYDNKQSDGMAPVMLEL